MIYNSEFLISFSLLQPGVHVGRRHHDVQPGPRRHQIRRHLPEDVLPEHFLHETRQNHCYCRSSIEYPPQSPILPKLSIGASLER